MGLSQGSYNSLKIADFRVVSESIRLSIVVTINRKVGLSHGRSNSLKIADFGVVLEIVGLSIIMNMNRDSVHFIPT